MFFPTTAGLNQSSISFSEETLKEEAKLAIIGTPELRTFLVWLGSALRLTKRFGFHSIEVNEYRRECKNICTF
ncbi:unknown protein [Paenibacillus amylolyticus]|uniref:Uncharacterized protein n=1 Tax=Paenibacillus amylolyticus TaxID=1451 RepID=A0A100VLJ8_PAEAM|nr:unknown protein [Paenibacillus amylolyticus]